MNEENKINRRKAIGGLGLGIAAMAGAPVLSSSAAGTAGLSLAPGLEDPTTKYPKPPFKEQKQP